MAFSDSLGNDVKIREKMIGRSVDQYAVEGQALAVGGEEVHQSYPQYDQEYHVSCVTTRSTIYNRYNELYREGPAGVTHSARQSAR